MSRFAHSALRWTILSVTLFALLLTPLAAFADGIIIVDPPICIDEPCPTPPCLENADCVWPPFPVGDQLEIKYHRVMVEINNQIATTKVDQLFYNPNDWQAEGIYIFPIPRDAAVSDFAMWVDGEKMEAEILDAEEARRIYTEIVAKRRDPALLEYIGQGAVQASIFPIPPDGERRIQIEYSQVLTADNGLLHYVYPLNTEKFSARPLESVSISVAVKSKEVVRAVYSPTHKIAVDRAGQSEFTASYEASNITPEADFELFYSVSPEDIGLNLITYRDPSGGDGFFVLLAAPGIGIDAEVVAKDVILVLDQSGSMEGSKFLQAQAALKYVLEHLNTEDRFNIISFSTGSQQYARELKPASQAGDAARWVDNLRAEGGTNIERALLEAMDMADRERPAILIFLTDGLPTEGVTDSKQILNDVNNAASSNVRLFSFGVGDDVDTILLDSLADENHGASAYVRPGDNIEETLSTFYNKVQSPVLTDLELDFGDILVSDVYPDPLPDLFAGGQLVIVGRYREGGGAGEIVLRGLVNGEIREFTYTDQTFRRSGGDDFIPRLWATRKIGYLLNQIRLHGENEEWVESIVNLSVRYGIVTPYTSYLITEDDVLSSAGREDAIEEQIQAFQLAPAPASGGGAVDASVGQSALENAETVDRLVDEIAEAVKIVGRTFLNVDGVWTDTQFDPTAMGTTKVQFGSEDYFALVGARPEFGAAFALGERVIVIMDGEAYEVVATDAPPLEIPPTQPPQSSEMEPASEPNTQTTPQPIPLRPPSNNNSSLCPAALIPIGLMAVPMLVRRKKW